ncbi:sigma-54 interaction domain-containing protein [Alkalicoccus luteus]|uniref:Sigma 54-interacting transcriptional regulator n=1 Tax=Alkalicoccus luteus TaxID=1237094 RepID=A0A969TY00_9BACI|nr:sigma 54-interacting transcriptional regulator [Alkalicoccus luteus]NJP38709.1 sigma 54-interacting transcriptional regulator [Alkalicoccus luteus]
MLPEMPAVYKQLLDQLDAGIHIVDRDGKSLIYNEKMSRIEGMNKEEVLRKNIMDIFMFASEEDSRLLQALKYGKSFQSEKQTYFTFKGKEITTINDIFPIEVDGISAGAVEIAEDITKLERMARRKRNDSLRFTFERIVGESIPLQETVQRARQAARTNSSVLLYGETGTGKELFAQSIHAESPRASGPFIAQNCAALPESLMEGILFGSVKGAYTGAGGQAGLFEQAAGGTLLLDEINSLSTPMQAKLLRILQEKTVRRLGGTKDVPVDVRIIAVLNEDPLTAMQEGRLRPDLYYRLSVVSLAVPPLRERIRDIPVLSRYFISLFNEQFQLSVEGLAEETAYLFHAYEWPGNVRELEHIIEGAMNMMHDTGRIEPYHLPGHMRMRFSKEKPRPAESDEHPQKSLKEHLEASERMYLEETLRRTNQNVTRAADMLGLSRQSLQYRLKKLKIQRPDTAES